METNLNFKCFGNDPSLEGGGSGRLSGNSPLARQSSVYSLTFDQFQNSLGKEFGSLNMDELLKNIWTAEETQSMASAVAASGGGGGRQDGGNQGPCLQRQGSLTLPRTLSQKTVDEVWRDMSKELEAGKNTGSGASMPQLAQKQPTLGEITLEEFLVRAGVVREDADMVGKPNPGGLLGDLVRANNNNTGFGIDFQQPSHVAGLMGSSLADNGAQIPLQSSNLPANVNGVRSSQQQPIVPQIPQQKPQQPQQQQQQQQQRRQLKQQQHQQHQQPIFSKQSAVSYGPVAMPSSTQLGSPGIKGGVVGLANPTTNGNLTPAASYAPAAMPSSTQLGSPGIKGGIVGLADPTTNGNLTQGSAVQGGGMGIVGLGGGVMGATGSPATLSSDGLAKRHGNTPYMFNGGLRGRKSNNAVEKVIERRQRRMIKNRESAARSRARKQAYTIELEQEVAKLKEENEELLLKQAEIMEMQKNQVLEMMSAQYGGKKRCLRRTQTGPW